MTDMKAKIQGETSALNPSPMVTLITNSGYLTLFSRRKSSFIRLDRKSLSQKLCVRSVAYLFTKRYLGGLLGGPHGPCGLVTPRDID